MDPTPWTDTLAIGFVVLYLPALLVCGLFYVWGRKTRLPDLGRVLRRSALVWLMILWACYTIVLLGLIGCDGDMLYGYTACRLLPLTLANASFVIWFISTAAGLIYGAIVAVFGAFFEWRAWRG